MNSKSYELIKNNLIKLEEQFYSYTPREIKPLSVVLKKILKTHNRSIISKSGRAYLRQKHLELSGKNLQLSKSTRTLPTPIAIQAMTTIAHLFHGLVNSQTEYVTYQKN